MTVLDRRAARVLLVDGDGRALLLRGGDPARPGLRWWFTPGGGLDEGETPAEGAARELFEETGLRVDPSELGPPVWHQVTEFSYDGRDYRQDQEFFLFRVPSWEVDTAGFDPEEQRTIDGHRWWSAAELDETGETIYPEELASLLRRLTGFSSPASAASPPASAASPSSSAAASPSSSAAASPSSSAAASPSSSAAAFRGSGC